MTEGGSVSRLDRITIAFLVFYFLIIALWFSQFTTVPILRNLDAHDYAMLGREIVRGNGMSTKQVFPRHIAFLQEHGLLNPQHLPNLMRYVMPTFANAAAQVFIPDPVKASVVQCGVWFFLSIPVFFLLARSLIGPLLALLSTGIFVALPGVWASSYNGLSEELAIFFILLLLYAVVKKNDSWLRYAGMGLAGGLLSLTRTQFAYVYILALLYLAVTTPKAARWRAVAISFAGYLLVMGPWIARNVLLTGNPLFSFQNTRVLVMATADDFEDLDMQLHAPTGLFAVLQQHGGAILKKFAYNLSHGIFTFSHAIGLYVFLYLAIMLTTRFIRTRDTNPEYERFKILALTLLIVNTLIVSLVVSDERFNVPLQPLLVIMLLQELWLILKTDGMRRAGMALTVLLSLAALGAAVKAERDAKPQKIAYCDRLKEILKPSDVIATDDSYRTALLNDVLSIRLPHAPAELVEISEKYIPIDYVMLSPKLFTVGPSESVRSYYRSYMGYKTFIETDDFKSRFEFAEDLPEGRVLYRKRGYSEQRPESRLKPTD